VETIYSQRGGILRRAMSQDNVEIVRRLYRALNARDFETIAELAHQDAEWIPDWRVGEGPVRGVENVIRFFTEQGEMLAEVRVEPEHFWETGNKVVVFVHATGRGRASDAPFDIRIAHLWTLKGGVVVRGEGFADRDEGLKVAGLSP
jgi:ketosteroid isomerase-like protein